MKLLAITLLLITLPFMANAQDAKTFTLDNDKSTMTIEGGSTVGSWDADVNLIDGTFAINLDALENGNGTAFDLTTFSVDVSKIESDSRRMNRNISSYLKEDDHPKIYFTLNGAEVADSDANVYNVSVSGVINAAGADKEVSFTTKAELKDDGSIVLSGVKELLFSDFGIDRPSAMLGTVRASEEIEIHYNLVLVAQ